MQEWGYLQRVVPQCGPALLPEAIAASFLPKLFGSEVSPAERKVCQLSIKFAGLGVANPSASSSVAHEVPQKATAHLANAICKATEEFDLAKPSQSVLTARKLMDARSRREAFTFVRCLSFNSRQTGTAKSTKSQKLLNRCLVVRFAK